MFNQQSHSTAEIIPFRPTTPSNITEITLGDSGNHQAIDLLLGALQFIDTNSDRWLTWVNPPQSHKEFFHRSDLHLNSLRLVYKDQQRSVFHLLYLALQAANSSWVIGPAQELSFRQIELLEQAAQHNGSRLLLLREQSVTINGTLSAVPANRRVH